MRRYSVTILRFVSIAALVLAACASPNSSRQCANGLFCPEGTECSADLTTCIKSGGCGNALVGADEECDDGNLDDSDDCLSTCKLNKCGDGKTNLRAEECDDGNSSNEDDCLTT